MLVLKSPPPLLLLVWLQVGPSNLTNVSECDLFYLHFLLLTLTLRMAPCLVRWRRTSCFSIPRGRLQHLLPIPSIWSLVGLGVFAIAMFADRGRLPFLLSLDSFFSIVAQLSSFGGLALGSGSFLVYPLLQLSNSKFYFLQGVSNIGGQICLIFGDIGDGFLHCIGGPETSLACG